jgi:type 1 fimbria pilin
MKKMLIAITLGLLMSSTAFAASTKTVEQVHQQMAQLKGQQVTVNGKVVKVNNGIMRRNFVHIQDGSGDKNSNKLIITSTQTAKVGNTVSITGTVVLDTDFGMGYKYPLLVEKATINIQ